MMDINAFGYLKQDHLQIQNGINIYIFVITVSFSIYPAFSSGHKPEVS